MTFVGWALDKIICGSLAAINDNHVIITGLDEARAIMVLTTRLVSFRVSKWLRNAPLLAIAYCVWPHHVVTLLWSSSTEKIWNLRNVLLFIKRLSKWKVLLKLNCFWGNLDAQITWIISPWGCGEGMHISIPNKVKNAILLPMQLL